jgi:hypothetical protein
MITPTPDPNYVSNAKTMWSYFVKFSGIAAACSVLILLILAATLL